MQTTDKTILLDCDEILLNGRGLLVQYLKEEHGLEYKGDPFLSYPSQWDIFGGSKASHAFEKAKSYIDGFSLSPYFYHLPPLDGAKQGVSELKAMGYSLIIITAACEHNEAEKARKKNLTDVFGDVFKNIYFVPYSARKIDYLKKFQSTYFIEDGVSHAIDALAAGHHPIILRQPSNALWIEEAEVLVNKCITVCDTWEGIIVHIKKHPL